MMISAVGLVISIITLIGYQGVVQPQMTMAKSARF